VGARAWSATYLADLVLDVVHDMLHVVASKSRDKLVLRQTGQVRTAIHVGFKKLHIRLPKKSYELLGDNL
jgi:hypothetical protein